jgi:hypothetical protein
MLFLAGNRARVTADTAVMIDYEAVPQICLPSAAGASISIFSANSSEQDACYQSGQHICSERGKDNTPLL